MNSQLLIAGMFRSGTTLLANLLSDHPEGLVVSDPFVYFFKHYRNLHMQKLGLADWDANEPTPDYFGGARRELFDSLQAADLQETISSETLQHLMTDIRDWKSVQHPELCARLNEIKAGTYAEAYQALMDLAVELYGDDQVALAGTKVSWCEEFLPAMARAFPDMKFVLPVRDLRGIVASQNSQRGIGEGCRPLLFYVRHWRKSVALAEYYSERHPLLKERVTRVRYEDLVSAPDETMAPIMEHLGLRPCSLSVAADGAGRTHNSSFDHDAQGVFTGSTARWRSILGADEVAAIEAFAGPELSLLGYDVILPTMRPLDCLTLECEPSFEQVSEWLKPFSAAAYLRDEAAREREYAAEQRRRDVLENDEAISDDEDAALFLAPGSRTALRKTWRS